MVYLGIIFLLIGVWQSNMRGTLSPMLTLIFGILGTLLIFIGNWHTGLFLVFLYVSWFLLMKIYNFSTYHLYFGKAVFLLIGYAVLIAFLFAQFNFHKYFWWYLGLIVLFLINNHRKIHQYPYEDFVNVFAGDDKEMRAGLEKSMANTIKYHILSSVVFVVFFVLAFSYFSW